MSVVPVKRPAAMHLAQHRGGDVGNVRLPPIESGHAVRVVVDPGDAEPAPGKLHCQGQTDVSLPHHRHRGGPALDPLLEAHRSTGLATRSLAA